MARSKEESILPSPKFIVSVLVVAVIILLAVLLPDMVRKQKFEEESEQEIAQASIPIEVSSGELFAGDIDNDGLADWEEALWGTDPLNPDSDGNGVLDGDEIATVRQNIAVTQSGNEEPLSLEDEIAREFYTAISILDRGGEITESDIEDLSNTLIERVATIETTTYGQQDLTVVPRNSATHQAYGERMFELVAKNPLTQEDLAPVLAVLQGDAITDAAGVNRTADKYLSFAADLLATDVPTDGVEFHLSVLNAVQGFGETIQRIGNIEDEPLIGLKGVADFESALDQLTGAYQLFLTTFNL